MRAKGLVEYVERHSTALGRVELRIYDKDTSCRRINLTKSKERQQVKEMSVEQLRSLFDSLGSRG